MQDSIKVELCELVHFKPGSAMDGKVCGQPKELHGGTMLSHAFFREPRCGNCGCREREHDKDTGKCHGTGTSGCGTDDFTFEAMCDSISPHGNQCMFVAGHDGGHEIQHMMGSEAWGSDKWPDEYHPAV